MISIDTFDHFLEIEFLSPKSKNEMNDWTEKIRALSDHSLNTDLILNLKNDSKYNTRKKQSHGGARSPTVRQRRKKTFGVPLEDCPLLELKKIFSGIYIILVFNE